MISRKISLGDMRLSAYIDGEWVDMGTVEPALIGVDTNKIKKLDAFNNRGLSSTLHNVEINYTSPIMRKAILEIELNHLLNVIKYTKHSKKLNKAYKRYAKVYEEYLDIK